MPLSNFFSMEQSNSFNQSCISFNQNVREEILKFPGRIDVVVISSAWLLYFYGDKFMEDVSQKRGIPKISNSIISLDGATRVADIDKPKVFEEYLDEAFRTLARKANKVIVVGPLPPAMMKFSTKHILKTSNKISTRDFLSQSTELTNLLIRKTSEFNFSYIDLAGNMCDLDQCAIKNNGKFLYGDPTHFSNFGQSHVMQPIFSEVLQRD